MLCRIGHDDAPRMDIVLELLKSAQVGGVTHLRDQSALFAEAFGEMREYTPEKKSMYAQWLASTFLASIEVVTFNVVAGGTYVFDRLNDIAPRRAGKAAKQ
uniref:Inner membrane protein n=1 Tax=Ascaris lumbricoides TaxID=6252 RepID=A0A0M3HSG7_ASCLU